MSGYTIIVFLEVIFAHPGYAVNEDINSDIVLARNEFGLL